MRWDNTAQDGIIPENLERESQEYREEMENISWNYRVEHIKFGLELKVELNVKMSKIIDWIQSFYTVTLL